MKIESLLFPRETGVADAVLDRHAVSIADRLLSGSGAACLVPFRESPQRELVPVAHGTCADGTVLVAFPLAEVDTAAWGSEGVEVRLDIIKEAPDASLQIRVASLHALARMHPVAASTAAAWSATGALPELLDVTQDSSLSLASLELGAVLLHGPRGVTKLHRDDLMRRTSRGVFPSRSDEFSCVELAAALPPAAWLEIVESVLTGHLTGVELGCQPIPADCPPVVGGVRLVDIDATGLTLMHFTSFEATTLFVPFPVRVDHGEQLRASLAKLLPLGWMPGHLPMFRHPAASPQTIRPKPLE